jgi:site-specific recombinase XerD
MKRKSRPVPEYLTEEEIERLFRAITDVRDRAMFRLAYHRGLRASELGKLTLSDYRPTAGRLLVHRLKGSRSGEYHLMAEEQAALRVWLRKRGTAAGPLFPSRNHRPITRFRLHQLMRRYCAAASIPTEKAHMHALKHSCGTHLSALEPDIAAIQDHLGHANIQNTMIYVQIASRQRDECSDRLRGRGWGGRKAA